MGVGGVNPSSWGSQPKAMTHFPSGIPLRPRVGAKQRGQGRICRVVSEAPQPLSPRGPGGGIFQGSAHPAAPHLRRKDGSLFPDTDRYTFRLCWWIIGSRIIQEKYVRILTAALQPMFSPFGKLSRKRLKICDFKSIQVGKPPSSSQRNIPISKAS